MYRRFSILKAPNMYQVTTPDSYTVKFPDLASAMLHADTEGQTYPNGFIHLDDTMPSGPLKSLVTVDEGIAYLRFRHCDKEDKAMIMDWFGLTHHEGRASEVYIRV